MENIKKSKLQETSWAQHWEDIKKWAYAGKSRRTEEGNKINQSIILNYMNAPLMESFKGTKKNIIKFIIIWYHNGKFYFNIPVEISAETIYKLTSLSNKGDPVPVGIKEGLVERITGTPMGKNSKGLIVGQIKSSRPKVVAKLCPQAWPSLNEDVI